jgi:two-component system NtrC family sensor kinase
LLQAVLPFGGYQSFAVGSGKDGLALVPKLEPDVILIDLELPDTSGLRVLEELNRQGFTIPTIMMTGYGSEGSAARALRLGVRDYLIKPFTTEEVLSSIERALSESRLRREKEKQAILLNEDSLRFKLLSAVGQSMFQDLCLDERLQRIVEAAVLATQAEVGLLLQWHESSECLQILSSQGTAGVERGVLPAAAGDERLRPVLEEGLAVCLSSDAGPGIVIQTGDTVRAVCQVPVRHGGKVSGLLSVDRRSAGNSFGQRDEQTLAILASYATLAIDQAQ